MLMLVNPYATATSPNTDFNTVKNSAVLVKLDVQNSKTAPTTADAITIINDGSQAPESAMCSVDDLSTISGSWTTDCTLNSANSGTNEISVVTGSACAESWAMADGYAQCVRISSEVKRPFEVSAPSRDFNLGYRPFAAQAAFKMGTQSTAGG